MIRRGPREILLKWLLIILIVTLGLLLKPYAAALLIPLAPADWTPDRKDAMVNVVLSPVVLICVYLLYYLCRGSNYE